MTHTASHIIISLSTPVQIASVKTRGGIAGAALVLVGFVVGLFF